MQNSTAKVRLDGVECARGKKVLLSNVDLSLDPGSVTGLVGPNGAGKSTLISVLVGEISPAEGSVAVNSTSVSKTPHRSRIFGVVTESHGLPGRVRSGSLVDYWSNIHRTDRNYTALLIEQMGVESFWRTQVRKLSTGMRRRLEIVLALIPRPPVVILDEPFNGLDLEGIEAVRALIRRLRDEEKSILLSTHTLHEIDNLADRSYAVHQGRLMELDYAKGISGATEAAYTRLHGKAI